MLELVVYGNPGGIERQYYSKTKFQGSRTVTCVNGTGGLLILYGNNINNNGNIISEGTNSYIGKYYGGGASGGGSINIFYKNSYYNSGSYSIAGGSSSGTNVRGRKWRKWNCFNR